MHISIANHMGIILVVRYDKRGISSDLRFCSPAFPDRNCSQVNRTTADLQADVMNHVPSNILYNKHRIRQPITTLQPQ